MKKKKRKKGIAKICKNCKLFDPKRKQCQVVILAEGKRVKIPVEAKDPCFFEEPYFDPITGEKSDFNEIQEVKFWVEDEYGRKTGGNGTVKMEYPAGFFGPTADDILGLPPVETLDDLFDLLDE